MKKIGLLALICSFTLLMSGCAKAQNDMPESVKQDIEFSIDIEDESDKQQMEYAEIKQEKQDDSEAENIESIETVGTLEEETNEQTESEPAAPTKEEVLSMREFVLKGMSAKEIDRLRENIKIANQQMESAYLYDDIFAKLEDKESLYWNYFDNKGDIQISATETVYNRFNAENFINLLEEMKVTVQNEKLRNDLQQIIDQTALAAKTHEMEYAYLYDNIFAKLEDKESLYWNYFDNKGDIQISATETVYNRFNAENFINLLEEMKTTVQNEGLQNDLQQIIDQTALAAVTHEMEYANNIYKLLHDMDYYLLRYGPEDVGKYTQDASVAAKYYGVLKVYADSSEVQDLCQLPLAPSLIEGFAFVDGMEKPVSVTLGIGSIQRGEEAYETLQAHNSDITSPNENEEYIIATFNVSYDSGEIEELYMMENRASLEQAGLYFTLSNGQSNANDVTSYLNNSIYDITLTKGQSAQGAVAFLQEKGNTEPLVFVGFEQTVRFDIN